MVTVDAVEQRLVEACRRAGRRRESVKLVAVSKLHPAARIREAYAVGLRDFGENYAQELRDKHVELAALPGLVWHAIGPVQVKNAKYIARAAQVFHALLDRAVAEELNRRRTGPPLDCLIEVNVSGEASKAGISPDAVPALMQAVAPLANLRVVGLMTMPPLTEDPEHSRAHFRALKELAERLGLPELSMGTTHDLEVAVAEGATLVRVGTAIFGERAT